jgi:hypothetical protein
MLPLSATKIFAPPLEPDYLQKVQAGEEVSPPTKTAPTAVPIA